MRAPAGGATGGVGAGAGSGGGADTAGGLPMEGIAAPPALRCGTGTVMAVLRTPSGRGDELVGPESKSSSGFMPERESTPLRSAHHCCDVGVRPAVL